MKEFLVGFEVIFCKLHFKSNKMQKDRAIFFKQLFSFSENQDHKMFTWVGVWMDGVLELAWHGGKFAKRILSFKIVVLICVKSCACASSNMFSFSLFKWVLSM